jgi:hypothetical protein
MPHIRLLWCWSNQGATPLPALPTWRHHVQVADLSGLAFAIGCFYQLLELLDHYRF